MSEDLPIPFHLTQLVRNVAESIETRNEVEELKWYFAFGVNVLFKVSRLPYYVSLFHLICKHNRVEILKWVLRYKLDKTEHERAIFDELYKSISDGKYSTFRVLLNAISNVREAEEKYKTSLIQRAVYLQRANFFYLLVHRNAHIDGIPNVILSPISTAVVSHSYLFVKKLISLGAKVNLDDHYHPLCLLLLDNIHNANQNTKHILHMLLEIGADPNARSLGRSGALHSACQHNRPDLAQLLLQYGASKSQISIIGETPLTVARRHNQHELVELLENHPFSLQAMCKIKLSCPAIRKRIQPTPVPFTIETRSKRQRTQ